MDEMREKIGYLRTDFKLFHLRDEQMRGFDWHYHDFHKFLWLVSGQVKYHVEGKAYELRPYDLLLIGRGEIHKPEVDFSQPYERYILYLSADFLTDAGRWGVDLSRCLAIAREKKVNRMRMGAIDNERLLELLVRMEQSDRETAFAQELCSGVLLLEFLIGINRIALRDNGAVFEGTARFDPKMVEMVRYINENLQEEITVEGLAGHFFISKYHMMRKFKEETGYSVHQYILEKRILRAKDLILAGVPANEVCYQCGFKDYSAFNRAFRRGLGMAPSKMKRY